MYTQHQPHVSTLPPWERRHLEQVPYQAKHQSPRLGVNEGHDSFEDQRHQHNSSGERHTALNSLPLRYRDQQEFFYAENQAPYASQHYSQPQQRSNSEPAPYHQKITEAQAFVTPRDPPTPPYSMHSSATNSPPLDPPRMQPPAPESLPGTMSTRERKSSRSQSNGFSKHNREHQRKHSIKSNRSDGPGFGSRLKSTFRDMFKRDPIDESEFERIDQRHWADED